MTIGRAQEGDFPLLKELWSVVFDEEPAFLEKFFRLRYSPAQIFVAREGSVIASALHALPSTYCKDGEERRCGFVVGAATYEKYRKQGLMSRLLSYAREEIGCPLTLFPAVRPFYEKNGYFTTSTMLGFDLVQPVNCSPGRESSPTAGELDAIYRQATAKTGALTRDPIAWEFLLDGYGLVAVDGAYALTKGNVAVETMATGRESAANLLGLLVSKNVQSCSVLPSSPFASLLSDRSPSVLPMGMATDKELDGVYIAEQY